MKWASDTQTMTISIQILSKSTRTEHPSLRSQKINPPKHKVVIVEEDLWLIKNGKPAVIVVQCKMLKDRPAKLHKLRNLS